MSELRDASKDSASSPAAGFTLLELLTVLAISAMIFVVLNQGLQFSIAAWDRQTHDLRADDDIATFDETLHRLIGSIDPGLSPADPPLFEGGAHAVRFISEDRVFRIGVLPGRRLALEWSSPYYTLTGEPQLGVSTLMEGVERLDIRYWRPGTGWAGVWTDQRPPALVRFHLVFPPVSGRHVPDLIAAPMREAWRS